MLTYIFFAPFGREGELFLYEPRDLRGPGPRAYFLYGQKVGKKPLKPTV